MQTRPFQETKPTLATSRVLSASDIYTFDPFTAVWSAGVITFKYTNHGLSSGDVVSISSALSSSPWNADDVTVTKIDKDQFSVPMVGNPGKFPNSQPYAEEAVQKRVTIECEKYSKTMYLPTHWQLESLGGATSVQIQAKLNDDAPWVNVGSAVTTLGLAAFSPSYNFMRFMVNGTGSPIIYTQK